MRLHPRLAPYQAAVLPLSKKETLVPLAREVLGLLQRRFVCEYDETQAIGRRYRRQDEIGTPFCVTVDFDSLDDHAVTVRERDSTDAGSSRHRRRSRVSVGAARAAESLARGCPAGVP